MFALRAVAIHEPAISQSTAANVAADSLVGIVLLLHTICAATDSRYLAIYLEKY